LEKTNRVKERLARSKELYDTVFSGFQRKVLDSYRIRNILKLYFMVKMSRELETAESFFYLTEAVKAYNESFPRSTRMLDEDPVGNVITLAQYMMEAKEPTRRTMTAQEVIARMLEKPETH
jgi:cellobiose-specific phosphotransferase system component IIA